MEPRLASSVATLKGYCEMVYRSTPEKFLRLPAQWRGFVLHHQRQGHTIDTVLDLIDRGQATATMDPQGVFDSYLGQSPQ